MIRAAVLIGVADTGGYPHLEAVGKGLDDVQQWILEQGDFGDRVTTLTDRDRQRVTADAIKDAIRTVLKPGTVEQLLVYFAGHGMNVGYQEFWLLSDAGDDGDAAVNLAGSVVRARYCGIPHVVFISDACRSASGTITGQATNGSVIFPNPRPGSAPGVVDVFYAAAVGDPALEVRPRAAAAGEYRAIYTTALVDGLSGKPSSITVDTDTQSGNNVIRPWPLQRYLPGAVTGLLKAAGLELTESQVPDAIISSPPEAWLATVKAPPRMPAGLGFARPSAPQETLSTVSERAIAKAITGVTIDPGSIAATVPRGPGADALATHIDAPFLFPAMHFETRCGFVVNGISVRRSFGRQVQVEVDRPYIGRVRVYPVNGEPANVLLEFENGTGTLLPAIPDFVGTLTFDDGRLMAVSYEPAGGTSFRQDVEPDLVRVAELRRVIAAAARLGTFRLSPDTADGLISKMRSYKFVDPCLAVYAAHALADLNRQNDIEDMDSYVRRDLHLHFFDVALLKRTPGAKPELMPPAVYPALPLLTQAWPLLEAYGVELPVPLGRIRPHLTNSLWTLFNPDGVSLMVDALDSGVI